MLLDPISVVEQEIPINSLNEFICQTENIKGRDQPILFLEGTLLFKLGDLHISPQWYGVGEVRGVHHASVHSLSQHLNINNWLINHRLKSIVSGLTYHFLIIIYNDRISSTLLLLFIRKNLNQCDQCILGNHSSQDWELRIGLEGYFCVMLLNPRQCWGYWNSYGWDSQASGSCVSPLGQLCSTDPDPPL